MTCVFDLADLQTLLEPRTPRAALPFDEEVDLLSRLSEEHLPDPQSVQFVFLAEASSNAPLHEVTRGVVTRLEELWEHSAKCVVGQAEKEETNRNRIGHLLHMFDRIWTVAGLCEKRFLCYQLSDKQTFAVMRHFRGSAAAHRDYTLCLNLFNGRWYGMRRRAGSHDW